MALGLNHLNSGWSLDQAIVSEDNRIVIIRFGHDWDPTCMEMDEMLDKISDEIEKHAVIYVVDISEVKDFNVTYELYDPCTVMFFYRNKCVRFDIGFGPVRKLTWPLKTKSEFISVVNQVVENSKKGMVGQNSTNDD